MRRIQTAVAAMAMLATAAGAQATPPAGQPYFAFMVDKPVTQKPGSPTARYPDALKGVGTQGTVVTQFVVDTNGFAEPASLKILQSSHALFSDAVRDALPAMLLTPAEARGVKVRQLVQQPFVFALAGQTPPALPTTPAQEFLPAVGAPRAPAAPTGKVKGWSLTQRVTMDSGNGRVTRITTKYAGTSGVLRQEITSGDPSRMSMVNLIDSATRTTTLIMAQRRSATRMRTPVLPAAANRSAPTIVRLSSRVDTLPGKDRVLGFPATRVRSAASMRVTETLGAVTCVAVQHHTTEVWFIADTTIAAVKRLMAQSFRMMLGRPGDDSLLSLAPRGSPATTVGRSVVSGPLGSTVLTTEVLDYSLGDLDAALFAIPEGYTVTDWSARELPTMGAAADLATRSFFRRFDTTAAAGAGRATCRRK